MTEIDSKAATVAGAGRVAPIARQPPLKLKDIWAIRVRLQLSSRVRNLAMFNLAIDSKLRACLCQCCGERANRRSDDRPTARS
jgi:hypothetical protein